MFGEDSQGFSRSGKQGIRDQVCLQGGIRGWILVRLYLVGVMSAMPGKGRQGGLENKGLGTRCVYRNDYYGVGYWVRS